jgi:N-acetyl-anhydromuramyl-L-alanine amidase AmpD
MAINIDDRTLQTSTDVYGPAIGGLPWGVVLHHTGDKGPLSEEGTIRYLQQWHSNPVSTHKLFRRDGTIVKIVPEHMQAWHAGNSRLGGREGCNSCLGYEISNTGLGVELYTPEEYEAVALSLVYDCALYRIPDSMVSSHKRVADDWVRAKPWRFGLGRKTDPRGWDWGRMWRRVDEIRRAWPPEFVGIAQWWNDTGPRVMST